MRILCFSDTHGEFGGDPLAGLGADGRFDLILAAGDIDRADRVLERLGALGARHGCDVVFVPGNHEYYRQDFARTRGRLLKTCPPNVFALDRGRYDRPGLRVLGATLWTDYALLGADRRAEAMRACGDAINDHRLIRVGDAPFLPEVALRQHEQSIAWLQTALAEPDPPPTVVVTHHVPHSRFAHPAHPTSALTAAFASDCAPAAALLRGEGAGNVRACIFGHHHWCHDETLGGVRWLSAQRGYPGEETGWTGPGILAF